MAVEDFAKYFEGVGVCKIKDGYKYNSIKLEMKEKTMFVIKMEIK